MCIGVYSIISCSFIWSFHGLYDTFPFSWEPNLIPKLLTLRWCMYATLPILFYYCYLQTWIFMWWDHIRWKSKITSFGWRGFKVIFLPFFLNTSVEIQYMKRSIVKVIIYMYMYGIPYSMVYQFSPSINKNNSSREIII